MSARISALACNSVRSRSVPPSSNTGSESALVRPRSAPTRSTARSRYRNNRRNQPADHIQPPDAADVAAVEIGGEAVDPVAWKLWLATLFWLGACNELVVRGVRGK